MYLLSRKGSDQLLLHSSSAPLFLRMQKTGFLLMQLILKNVVVLL